jgi:DNA invertase Pin-like site-specific DNA recombinase
MAWSVDRLGRSLQDLVCVGLEGGAQGKRLGRPKVPASVERSILGTRAAGKGQLAIARELRVGVGTVRRVLGLA